VLRLLRSASKVLIGILAAATFAAAEPVTLGWDPGDPVPNTTVTGYNLHWGPSEGNYQNEVDVGDVLQHTLDIPADTWIVASAYGRCDDSGVTVSCVSPFSNAVRYLPINSPATGLVTNTYCQEQPMATIIVKQDGTEDYTTLAAAVANAGANDVIEIQGSWSADETASITISTSGLTIRTAGDASHPGHAQGTRTHYRIKSTSGHVFTIAADDITFDGLDMCQAGTGTSDEVIRISYSGGTVTVKNALIWAANWTSQQDGIYVGSLPVTVNIINSVIHGFMRAGLHAQASTLNSTQTWNINSCLIYGNGDATAELEGGGLNIKNINTGYTSRTFNVNIVNSIFLDNHTKPGTSVAQQGDLSVLGDVSGTINLTVVNSIFGDTTPTAAGNLDTIGTHSLTGVLASRTATDDDTPGTGNWVVLEDITSAIPDLRLKSSDENDAQDVHATSTGAGMTIPTLDMLGSSRPQNANYDLGPVEIISGPAQASVDNTEHSHSAGGLSITQHQEADPEGAAHAHAVGALDVAQHHAAMVSDSFFEHTAEPLEGTQHHVVSPDPGEILHTAESPEATQHQSAQVEDAQHVQGVDQVTPGMHHTVSVGSAQHEHAADSVSASRSFTVEVANAEHNHLADLVNTTSDSAVVVNATWHGHTADPVSATQHFVVQVEDSTHAVLGGRVMTYMPTGDVYMSFAYRKPGMAFSARQPLITYTWRKPGISFRGVT